MHSKFGPKWKNIEIFENKSFTNIIYHNIVVENSFYSLNLKLIFIGCSLVGLRYNVITRFYKYDIWDFVTIFLSLKYIFCTDKNWFVKYCEEILFGNIGVKNNCWKLKRNVILIYVGKYLRKNISRYILS